LRNTTPSRQINPEEVHMDRANINGAELDYEVSGNGEAVICIHGAIVADTFRPMLSEPAIANRYRLILYHRRGYAGSSRLDGPISIKQQADDCRALLRHLGVGRAHVVGHSYGGSVALQLALNVPDLVHSLALLEPALAIGASADEYRHALMRSVARFREGEAAIVVDEFLQARSPGYRPGLDRLLPGAFDQAVADAGPAFEQEAPGLIDWQFTASHAQQIAQPTLSVVGGNSEALWPRFGEAHRWLLESLPNAEGFVLPGATHMLQLEDPHGMAEALTSFWSRHPMRSPSA
jgi:pimeloyl-ACP methyl ester carboxylesterase